MLIVFLIICILSFIICGISDWLKEEKSRRRDNIDYYVSYDERSSARKELMKSKFYKVYTFFNGISDACRIMVFMSGAAVAVILLVMLLIWSPKIDKKIALYEEENIKIETQIATVVNQYQEFEHSIIIECKPESAMTLVALYPDLKSDILVAKQIETYIANNDKIKELKEEKINQELIGWWFNFNAW